ncbi:MAG: hypothetical protein MMC23_003831 [Stictis urceolatum]|nr:hypothetical protein [Stictis urceolata]
MQATPSPSVTMAEIATSNGALTPEKTGAPPASGVNGLESLSPTEIELVENDNRSVKSTRSNWKLSRTLRRGLAEFGIIPAKGNRKDKALAEMKQQERLGQKKYRRQAHYIHDALGDTVFEEELEDSFSKHRLSASAGQRTAIVLVTRLQTSQYRSDILATLDPPAPPIKQRLGDKVIIKSKAIITALLSVATYYPGQFLAELADYRKDHGPGGKLAQEVCQNQPDMYEDLAILQNFLDDQIADKVAAERQRHERGVATFSMLWLLFKPGTDVYSDEVYADHGNWNKYVVHSITGGLKDGTSVSYFISLWCMDYDGAQLGRRPIAVEIPPFDGERELSALHCLPCEILQRHRQ